MTRIIWVDPERPDRAAIAAAAAALRAGGVIGVPTDTVYGLAADPFQATATERIFDLKGRPHQVSLPVLVADVEQAETLVDGVSDQARRLMDRYWPGPLTVVLPQRTGRPLHLGTDHRTTVGVRCPDSPVVRALCRATGPIATTSANRHGEDPLTEAAAVAEAFGDGLALVFDAGACQGVPSTLCDCTQRPPVVLRHGRIWADELRAVALGAPGPEGGRH